MRAAKAALITRPKTYKWSPRLRNAGVLFRYWKLRLREITWERQIQSLNPTFQLPSCEVSLDIQEVRLQLTRAHKHLRQTQKKATKSRIQSYEELLQQYEADTDPITKSESQKRAKIVSWTIQGEACRSMYGKIRQIIQNKEYSSVSQIQIPRPETNASPTEPGHLHTVLQHTDPSQLIWDTVITRDDIEAHLLSFNREAFRAAAESPCGSGVIHNALTFSSLSDEAEQCLKGVIPESWYGDRELLREFLASFQIPNSLLDSGPIRLDISTNDIIRGFKSWQETTNTSPSGRHLGHYKALIMDPILLECFCKFLT